MGDWPKGAGGAAALPRKNNSARRNENRAIVNCQHSNVDFVRTEIGSLLKSSEIHKLSDKFGTRYIQVSKYLDIYCFNLIFVYELAVS